MLPEWHLSESSDEKSDYEFVNVNPRSVLFLALAAAFVAVASVFLAYQIVRLAIANEVVSPPPRLQQYVS